MLSILLPEVEAVGVPSLLLLLLLLLLLSPAWCRSSCPVCTYRFNISAEAVRPVPNGGLA